MQLVGRIPRNIEKPFREALNHAAHQRVGELRALLASLTGEQVAECVRLCAYVAAYTAIDVVSRRWPNDEGVRQMADGTAKSAGSDAWPGITPENLYLFLSRCGLGFEEYASVFDGVFSDAADLWMAPFFLTIELVAAFGPEELSIPDFLDVAEEAYETAQQVDLSVLPALMLRSRAQPEQ